MEITGRITKDASVHTTKAGKEVVNFSLAVNESYKQRQTGERKEIVTYFNCAYWRNKAVAKILRKGNIVLLSGRPKAVAYTDGQGNVHASLQFTVREIELKHSHKTAAAAGIAQTEAVESHPTDDLPF